MNTNIEQNILLYQENLKNIQKTEDEFKVFKKVREYEENIIGTIIIITAMISYSYIIVVDPNTHIWASILFFISVVMFLSQIDILKQNESFYKKNKQEIKNILEEKNTTKYKFKKFNLAMIEEYKEKNYRVRQNIVYLIQEEKIEYDKKRLDEIGLYF